MSNEDLYNKINETPVIVIENPYPIDINHTYFLKPIDETNNIAAKIIKKFVIVILSPINYYTTYNVKHKDFKIKILNSLCFLLL